MMAIIDEIGRMLAAVKEASGAMVVGLFDCDLARLHASSEAREADFWKVFSGLQCLNLDRQQWHRDLQIQGRAWVSCNCEIGHAVQGVLFNDRWALVLLENGPLEPTASSVILSAIPPMADLLPLNRVRRKRGLRGGGEPTPAELGIPLWWLRRNQ